MPFNLAQFNLYPSIAISIFGCYIAALALHIFAIAVLSLRWKKLPSTFRNLAAISITLLLVNFIFSVLYIVRLSNNLETTLHTIEECTVGRKVIYAFVYSGFLVFDIVFHNSYSSTNVQKFISQQTA